MQDFITFLNQNQGAATALLTTAIVMLTGATVFLTWRVASATERYVDLTSRLVAETVLLRGAETEPSLEVYIEPNDKWTAGLDLVIRNSGRAAARDIQWTIDADHEALREREMALSPLPIFQGLPYVAPGQSIRFFWAHRMEVYKEPRMAPVAISATYMDDAGKRYERRFPLMFEMYENMSRVVGEQEDLVEAVKKGTAAVENIASGGADIRVIIAKPVEVAPPVAPPPGEMLGKRSRYTPEQRAALLALGDEEGRRPTRPTSVVDGFRAHGGRPEKLRRALNDLVARGVARRTGPLGPAEELYNLTGRGEDEYLAEAGLSHPTASEDRASATWSPVEVILTLARVLCGRNTG